MLNKRIWEGIHRFRYVGATAAAATIGAGALIIFWPMMTGKILFGPTLYHYIYFGMMRHFVYGLGMLPNW